MILMVPNNRMMSGKGKGFIVALLDPVTFGLDAALLHPRSDVLKVHGPTAGTDLCGGLSVTQELPDSPVLITLFCSEARCWRLTGSVRDSLCVCPPQTNTGSGLSQQDADWV